MRQKRKWVDPEDVAKQFVNLKRDMQGFTVKEIAPKGRTVVTDACFEKGEFLLQYSGSVCTAKEGDLLEEINSSGFRFFIKFKGKGYCIDATEEPTSGPTLGRLVNHGEKGEVNVKLVTIDVGGNPALCLFALRNIERGEELLYVYGDGNSPWKNCTRMKPGRGSSQPQFCLERVLSEKESMKSTEKVNGAEESGFVQGTNKNTGPDLEMSSACKSVEEVSKSMEKTCYEADAELPVSDYRDVTGENIEASVCNSEQDSAVNLPAEVHEHSDSVIDTLKAIYNTNDTDNLTKNASQASDVNREGFDISSNDRNIGLVAGGIGKTPLMLAVISSDRVPEEKNEHSHALIENLILQGANVNAKTDKTGETALHFAAQFMCPGAAKILIDHGAHVNSEDNNGRKPLHTAVAAESYDILRLLVSNRATNVDAKTNKGITPLTMAARLAISNIEDLIEANGDVNLTDHDGKSALHLTASVNNISACQILLQSRANRCIQDHMDQTPLLIPSKEHSVDVVKCLIDHHVNREITDHMDRSACDIAQENYMQRKKRSSTEMSPVNLLDSPQTHYERTPPPYSNGQNMMAHGLGLDEGVVPDSASHMQLPHHLYPNMAHMNGSPHHASIASMNSDATLVQDGMNRIHQQHSLAVQQSMVVTPPPPYSNGQNMMAHSLGLDEGVVPDSASHMQLPHHLYPNMAHMNGSPHHASIASMNSDATLVQDGMNRIHQQHSLAVQQSMVVTPPPPYSNGQNMMAHSLGLDEGVVPVSASHMQLPHHLYPNMAHMNGSPHHASIASMNSEATFVRKTE